MRWSLECVELQYVELKECVELEELELLSSREVGVGGVGGVSHH